MLAGAVGSCSPTISQEHHVAYLCIMQIMGGPENGPKNGPKHYDNGRQCCLKLLTFLSWSEILAD